MNGNPAGGQAAGGENTYTVPPHKAVSFLFLNLFLLTPPSNTSTNPALTPPSPYHFLSSAPAHHTSLLQNAPSFIFLPPSMPRMPPAVRKCQAFTTRYPPPCQAHCLLAQKQRRGARRAHRHTRAGCLCAARKHNEGNLISQERVWH